MKKIIYHGAENRIELPQYGKGARNNDYGRGFYCTENEELAKEWACSKNRNGFANQYVMDLSGLKILDLNDGNYCILHWLALLAKYRTYWQRGSIAEEAKRYIEENFLLDISSYDVVIGYRADDSYFSFAQDFVAGTISYERLTYAMRLGKLGEQIVLKSPKAFECLEFVEAFPAYADEYYIKKKNRDRDARKEYRSYRQKKDTINELYILDIMREGMINGDPRLY